MDKRILEIVSNTYLNQKVQAEVELEKLINNNYNISVEETTERIMGAVSKLNNVVHDMQVWESILSQVTPNKPDEGPINNNKKTTKK